MTVVRFGILGAAAIAPAAIVRPAAGDPGAQVVAVAARARDRAQAFAAKHDIARVHETYEALLADPEVDAIYNPLPNGLHGRWTVAAIEAGKHVLCEKPFAANAEEARAVAEVVRASDRVVMEAFHWRYHPLAARVLEIIASGEIGELREVSGSFCFPLVKRSDIRWSLALAGGALMDAGCYPVHMLRTLVGTEPEVVSAACRIGWGGVDRVTTARLQFPSGPTGKITASMLSRHVIAISLRVVGSRGSLRVVNPLMPKFLGSITVKAGGTKRRECPWPETTYSRQLTAFLAAVNEGTPFPTDIDDAVANMAVIDAIYRAAGVEPRQPTT